MSNANVMGQGHGTLSRAAGMVATAKQDFDRISRDLSGKISGLQGQWVGAGGTAFMNLHQEWTRQHQVITNALNEFEAALTSTERDNTSTDEGVASPMTNLTSRLG